MEIKVIKPISTLQEAEELKKSIQTQMDLCYENTILPDHIDTALSLSAIVTSFCIILLFIVLGVAFVEPPIVSVHNYIYIVIILASVSIISATIYIACRGSRPFRDAKTAEKKYTIYIKAECSEDNFSDNIDMATDLIKEAEAIDKFTSHCSMIRLDYAMKNSVIQRIKIETSSDATTATYEVREKILPYVSIEEKDCGLAELDFSKADDLLNNARQKWLAAVEKADAVS